MMNNCLNYRKGATFLLRWLKDERGAVLPVVVVLMAILIAALSILWDWSRVQIHWRGLQTAADAAALAGAMEGERWDRVVVDKRRRVCETGADGRTVCWWEYDTVALDGRDTDLFQDDGRGPNGWRRRSGCSIAQGWICDVSVTARWVQFDPVRVERAARDAFHANVGAVDPLGLGGFAWRMESVDVQDRVRGPGGGNDPNEDVVAVRVQGTTQFHLLPALGRAAQEYQRCAESRAEWGSGGRGYQPSHRC